MTGLLAFALASLVAQAPPVAPYSIRLSMPDGESDERGANPVDSVDVEIEWRHLGNGHVFEVYLDQVLEAAVPSDDGFVYRHTFEATPVGDHEVEVRSTNGFDCPPATERPTGCSRYFAFTVLGDGSVLGAPTGVRIIPQEN